LTYENCDKGTKSLSEELPSTAKDCKVCLVTLIKKLCLTKILGLTITIILAPISTYKFSKLIFIHLLKELVERI